MTLTEDRLIETGLSGEPGLTIAEIQEIMENQKIVTTLMNEFNRLYNTGARPTYYHRDGFTERNTIAITEIYHIINISNNKELKELLDKNNCNE